MAKTSPTQRSLKVLRDEEWIVAIVEHWNPWVKIRQDLFGFADLLAIRPGEIAAIQVTSGSNVAARKAKILAEPKAEAWLKAGGTIYVQGWRQLVVERGKKKKKWAMKHLEITTDDFEQARQLAQSAAAEEPA